MYISDENSLDSSKDVQNLADDFRTLVSAGGSTPDSERHKVKMYSSLKEFDENLPHTVTVLDTPVGSKVYLVGTAHFSTESQDDVSLVIRNVRPDIVMVELCSSRVHILKHDEKTLLEEASEINLTKVNAVNVSFFCYMYCVKIIFFFADSKRYQAARTD